MEEDMITFKILAAISLVCTYIGTMLPLLLHAAQAITPFLQDGAYTASIIAGVLAIFKSRRSKK